MRFRCIEDYDNVAKKGQIWRLEQYSDSSSASKTVQLKYRTDTSLTYLHVDKERFLEHFMFLGF